MPSPFPGMDPYLERPDIWADVHLSLIIYMKDALNASLPAGYSAIADRFVWIHEPGAEERTRFRPDIVVNRSDQNAPAVAITAFPAPLTGVLPAVKREGNKYLKILDVRSRRVITAIELLSPSNKQPGPDREAFLMKRTECLNAGVNLVEIDLHRGGQRLPLVDAQIDADYYAMVCRAVDAPRVDIWPFSVRDRLPEIPIPLVRGTPEPLLNLAQCFDRLYESSRYGDEIDYSSPCDPPLGEADAVWARQLIASTN